MEIVSIASQMRVGEETESEEKQKDLTGRHMLATQIAPSCNKDLVHSM